MIQKAVDEDKLSIIPVLAAPVYWEHQSLRWLSDFQTHPRKPHMLSEYVGNRFEFQKVRHEILTSIRHAVHNRRKQQSQSTSTSGSHVGEVQEELPEGPGETLFPEPAAATRKSRKKSKRLLGRIMFLSLLGILAIFAICWIFWPHSTKSCQIHSAPPLLAGKGPPYSSITVVMEPSAYWHPQTHPNCQAITNVRAMPDDQTIEVLGKFQPGRSEELKTGEVIVFVAQGAASPKPSEP